jgi:outer membrane protein assembly factor BamB
MRVRASSAHTVCVALIVIAIASFAGQSRGAAPLISPLFTINAPAPQAAGEFGFNLTPIGNRLLIGERRAGSEVGRARLYTSAGSLITTFNNPTPSFGDHYSQYRGGLLTGVGASQDLIAIPDHGDDVGSQNAGSVHIYDATTFSLLRTISNPAPVNGGNFGTDITNIPGTDQILIGASEGGFGGAGPGHAYVYDARTGALALSLNNPTPATPDYFGNNVEVSNGRLVVAAFEDDTGHTNAGSAYVFNPAGTLLHTLQSPTGNTISFASSMCAIPGTDLVAVNDIYDSTIMSMAGSVHLFSTLTGALVRTIDHPFPTINQQFGEQVGVVDGDLLVATTLETVGGFNAAGAVYRFDINTGDLKAIYRNPNPHAGSDIFGTSMAVIGNRLYIGAPGNDATPEPGYVYAYDTAVPEPAALALLSLAPLLLSHRRAR